MTKNPLIEQLIEAQLDFLDQEFSQFETVQNEFQHFYEWLKRQQLQDLWAVEDINALLQKQILATAPSDSLIQQIAEHIRLALEHPENANTKIEHIVPVHTIDRIAQYIASKSTHRQALIKRIVNNPAFSNMLTQLIHHSIQDYIDNSVMNKKVPGVGRFMKMGKSMLETVTDTNLDDTVKHYLQKNIIKISQLSEQVINQQFDDDKLYHFQANLWHKIKQVPLSVVRQYVEISDLPQTVGMGHEVWNFLRQTDYLQQQVKDGVQAWYARNQQHTFEQLLRDINIDVQLVEHELQKLLHPVLMQLITSGHLRVRARVFLEKFYYSETVLKILSYHS